MVTSQTVLRQALDQLKAEDVQLQRQIRALEDIVGNRSPRRRSNMSAAKRRELSVKMKKIWAQRRKAK